MKCPKCNFENPADSLHCGRCAAPLPSLEEVPFVPTETFQTSVKELTRGTTFADRYEVADKTIFHLQGRNKMRNRIITLFFFIVFMGFYFQSIAQFTPEELAERAKWEEFLKTAEITSFYQMKGREAVTEPWVLTLEKDGIKRQAMWKDIEGRGKGFMENWKWEIAAYRLDKYLALNMVPPTVEKRFRGNRGSCQLWVDYWIKAKVKNEQKIKVPSYKVFYYNRATYLRWAFDNLIANEDRHSGNIFITKDWRTILPDHSRSFRTAKKFTKNLIYTEKHKEGPKIVKELPRAFVEKLNALNFEAIKDVVGEYLTDKEIKALLMRRDLIIDEINKRIKKLGEDKVLY